MPITQTYYLDGTDLSTSSSIYLDIAQTTCAPDGFYSDGVIVREQVNCGLLPAQPCPNCGGPCFARNDPGYTYGGGVGIYKAPINLGTNVGAVIVEFNPNFSADGIKVEYDSVLYDTLSSQTVGLIQSAIGPPVFFGDISFCTIGGISYLPEYKWDGSAFNLTPISNSVNVTGAQIVDTGGPTGNSFMVIPKLTANPQNIDVTMYSTCDKEPTDFTFAVRCPRLLDPFISTSGYATFDEACNGEPDQTYYYVSVNGSGNQLGYYDWVFSDPYGQNVLPDGWYAAPIHLITAGATTFEVQNGIIVNFQLNCAPTDLTSLGKDFYTGCTAGGINITTLSLDWEPTPENVFTASSVSTGVTYPVLNGVYTAKLTLDFDAGSVGCPPIQVNMTVTDCCASYSSIQTYTPVAGGQIIHTFQFNVNPINGPYILDVNLYNI